MILRNVLLCVLLVLCIVSACNCREEEETKTGTTSNRSRPKYTELKRPKTTRTTTTTTTEPSDELDFKSEDESEEEDDEEPPKIVSNGRGGVVKESLESEEEEEVKPKNTRPRTTESPSGGKKYVEYVRPGATPRTKPPKTTRAPIKRIDPFARPNSCNECRYYCKQCRGAEEVTSGGIWGCCNHNCCGGRCSCQKVKL